MQEQPLNPEIMSCPKCGEQERIGNHSHKQRRYKCHACGGTFSETKGTIFYGLHYPIWLITVVLKLLAYGCPIPAIVFAFEIDERTIAQWHQKAGQHAKKVQGQIVCNGQVELGQVQADELCVNKQGSKKVWMATAMTVFSRLWIWGEVSTSRDKGLIYRLMSKVRTAAVTGQAILFAVDGFSAYPKVILKAFSDKYYSRKAGRPPMVPWPNLVIVQVVKNYSADPEGGICRRIVHGSVNLAWDLIAMSQSGLGKINTAYIERLNATFRARMPALVRRTRCLARTIQRLETEMFWSGTVYNFCTVHSSLDATPAMAAGLTDHIWSVDELLHLRFPLKPLHPIL